MVEITNEDTNYGARIAVIGVGGAGNNAVDRMVEDDFQGMEFICVNTDSQQLKKCKCRNVIQIGEKLTKGRGAGARPEVGKEAAEESREIIAEALKDFEMVFIACGMGGGTGTGAAPVIAQIAKEMGILTVAVVTKPFSIEGTPRMNNALEGIAQLKEYVDTIVIIPNDKLIGLGEKKAKSSERFKMSDTVIRQGVQGISDIINKTGDINLDFADICTCMKDKGVAHFGIGRATGEDNCINAAKAAIESPLLETSIEGAENIILHFYGDLIFDDMIAAADYVKDIVGQDTNVIFGECDDESEPDTVTVTLIATGLKNGPDAIPAPAPSAQGRQQASGLGFLGGARKAAPAQGTTAQTVTPGFQTRQPAYRPQGQTTKPVPPVQPQGQTGYRSPKQNQTPADGSSILIPEWISRQNNN